MALIRDEDGNWTDDSATEIDREDPARRDWEQMKRQEEEWLRRHQTPDLQIIPTEREEEKPRTPTPDQIQSIIDGMDTPALPVRKPYMN